MPGQVLEAIQLCGCKYVLEHSASWIQCYSHTTRHLSTLYLSSIQSCQDWHEAFLNTVTHISLSG